MSLASDITARTVLNANTTGSGIIGTLDTTLLQNGGYWIELSATDSTGVSQYNVALITVAGTYKPGRVTGSITDLTVPAPGLPISIIRTYDSLERGQVEDFGNGWALSTSVHLTVDPANNVTLTVGAQRRTFYESDVMTIAGGWRVLTPRNSRRSPDLPSMV
jgi:hypothetical protein